MISPAQIVAEVVGTAAALSQLEMNGVQAQGFLAQRLPAWSQLPGIEPLLGGVREIVDQTRPAAQAPQTLLRLAHDLVRPDGPCAPKILSPRPGLTLADLVGEKRTQGSWGKLFGEAASDPAAAMIEALWVTAGNDSYVQALIAQGGAYSGPFLAHNLFARVVEAAIGLGLGASVAPSASPVTGPSIETPHVNTIPPEDQIEYPGGTEAVAHTERLAQIARFIASTMVARSNHENKVGGHIGTMDSNADIALILLLHFLKGRANFRVPDVYRGQGHDSPFWYAILRMLGVLTDKNELRFRREVGYIDESGQPVIDEDKRVGLPSYEHAEGRPDIWTRNSVVMGLGGLSSVWQPVADAWIRNHHENISERDVWVMLGDAASREPEHQADLDIPVRDKLKVRHLYNINHKGLDGPPDGDGNSNVMRTLERRYAAAGWKVIKVVTDSHWDPLLAKDTEGLVQKRLSELNDGDFQAMVGRDGAFIREYFFNGDGHGTFDGKTYHPAAPNPKLKALVADLTDDEIVQLGWGGHDPIKIFNALKQADEHDGPAVVLFNTVKGLSIGRHAKSLTVHGVHDFTYADMLAIRDALNAPFSDEELGRPAQPDPADPEGKRTLPGTEEVRFPFWRAEETDPDAIAYLRDKRDELGGVVPQRVIIEPPAIELPDDIFRSLETRDSGQLISTTALYMMLNALMTHPALRAHFPVVLADENNTFGGNNNASRLGYFSLQGQLYLPANADRPNEVYRQDPKGQFLPVGISEAAAMAVWGNLATAYADMGVAVIPIFISYSMFLMQHVGSWIWGAQDDQARGILVGGTAGKDTLSFEGTVHQDGNSPLIAHAHPRVRTFDPAFPFDMAAILKNAVRRMYGPDPAKRLNEILYLLTYNEKWPVLGRPQGVTDDMILRGLYTLVGADERLAGQAQATLISSGPILFEALKARDTLQDRFRIGIEVMNATSYGQLAREASAVADHNIEHPRDPRVPLVTQLLAGRKGPIVASSDYMEELPGLIRHLVPQGMIVRGTGGMGKSDTRRVLRRRYKVDAESQVLAVLFGLLQQGTAGITPDVLEAYMAECRMDPRRRHPSIADPTLIPS